MRERVREAKKEGEEEGKGEEGRKEGGGEERGRGNRGEGGRQRRKEGEWGGKRVRKKSKHPRRPYTNAFSVNPAFLLRSMALVR
jgi:hypothetical protein